MKKIAKLIMILSVFAQVCQAQKIETVDEYKIFYDSIVSHLKLAEKNANSYINKPLSEFVEYLNEYDVKIIQIWMEYKSGQLYPKDILGVRLLFTTREENGFASENWLIDPWIVIYFNETKSYEKGLDLSKKYKSYFTEEVEAFYSDAIVKSIGFYGMDKMYKKRPIRPGEMKSRE
ncbi:hypothetical protein FACS189451_09130 [Bacteroidia bacterium]|nr:hypothetical protein FACS189451_09130 [Bacteroidia bacterium]